MCCKLIWFNDNTYHFIFQCSDNGAPESSQLTMFIGSLTSWNFGDRVRSRDFQYIFHCVSLGEKHEVLESIWKQHTDEIQMLEGNIFNVCEKQCTLEFQPSTNMSWQSWANNELNQAVTFPSPYANVSKGNISTMGATIGLERRASGKVAATVTFTESMSVTMKKDNFLSNPKNKQSFLLMLSKALQNVGCVTHHANGDADLLIVQTAVESA